MTAELPEAPSQEDASPARADTPGPEEPKSIAASILPQRLKDRSRHPVPPEFREVIAVTIPDDVVSAAEELPESSLQDQDGE